MSLSLVLLYIVGSFATGLQSLPFFSLLFYPVLLNYTRKQWKNNILAFIVNTLAVSTATLTTFDIVYGTPPFTHFSRVLVYAAVNNLFIIISTLIDRLAFINKNSGVWTRVLLFPCMWTYLWHIHDYYGDGSGYSNSTSDWAAWAQIVDLGGKSLLDWLLALFGTCLLEYDTWSKLYFQWKESSSISATESSLTTTTATTETKHIPSVNQAHSSLSSRLSKIRLQLLLHPLSLYMIVVGLLYVYGEVKSSIRRGAFFQKPIKDWAPDTIPVACVIGSGGFDMELRSNYSHWMDKSIDASQRGAKLVLWSEEVVLTETLQDEERLRAMAIKVAMEQHIYLVIAYDRQFPTNHNMAVLISPQGDILIDYIKANPVPFDEDNEPGPGVLLYVDIPEFGRIGLVICYDLSMPKFIRQAGQNNVDVLLQPAFNWGAGAPSVLRNQQLRPIENGFTLFRCVSQGISGIIEPVIHGHYEQKTVTISNSVYIFNLPLQQRIKTLYSDYIGDFVPMTSLAFSIVILTRLHFF
ncbi:carbon-nitrogen hydrolase [Halteromyces radiatus]|uniref:carbon-nitrogen hydrolase n=1 Tax=Halteromyces radiatus TaxID=101107 RepID=UPI0022209466|nr:carbon-nitrogen hydrolase [Halteromyces radiatus]KAI8081375.1 carbon-nitrogen hydrolase [Halteromyces radiatus]